MNYRKPTSSNTRCKGLHDTKVERHSRSRIDRVSTLLENVSPHLGSNRIIGRNHAPFCE
jgi:hypothetical protein